METLTRLQREYVMHAETPVDELNQLAIDGLTGYFRSHPLPSERLAAMHQVVVHDRLTANTPLRPIL
jgi:predicted Zn-dependent protease